ncbi:uncharacterized protein LOC134248689 [Saccostrea cucullata]|uniref:uncharacterized protein LOC134248689 n=1 Tax=Saccostrea cuccullata TaxID=36930 RepID=UPI002ED41A0D
MSSRMEFPTFPLSLTKTSSALTEKCANFESEENEKRIHGSENRKCSCYSLSNETKNRESVIIVESQTLDEYNVSPSGHSRRYDEDNIKYMDEDVEDIEEPDISVRDKQPLLADYSGDGYVTLKEKAKERLENALFNFTIYMEKDDECLETFLKNDHYKLLMENINSYSKTEVTAKEIPLLSNYAELVESRFKDIRIE